MSSAISGSLNLNRAQTQISIDESYATVQDVSKFDAVELLGHVFVDATADYRASIKLSLVKNGAGTYEVAASDIAGDDYSGSPIVEFQMSGSALQAKIPSGIPGFSSAYVKYSLSAPAAAASDLSVDSENILFDTIVPKDANGISVKNTAGDTTNVFVADAGNVGIGTTSPRSGYKFHIQESTGNGLNIQAGDESTDVIATFGSAGTPDKVVIEAGGRLLASGNITVRGENDSGGGIDFFNLASASRAFQITTNTSDFYITDSDFSNFAQLGGQSFAGWTFGSDRRIKENIQDCRYGLESVLKIQPRQYNLIASGEESIGFVAQELMNVIPEAVTGQEVEYDENDTPEERAKKTLGVCKETLIPVLVKAIQEQQVQIAALEARLAALESK